MNTQMIHYQYMLQYAFSPESLNLNSDHLEGHIIEPVWYMESSQNQKSLCDIVFLLSNGVAIPTEIKSSTQKKNKAIEQICFGKEYCENLLYREVTYGILCFYKDDFFEEYIF